MKNKETSLWLFLRRMRTPLIVLNIVHAIPVILLTLIPGVDGEGNPYHLSFFDAMYIVGYTATTIGFGEIPYAFTYEQRIIVFLTVYICVPAWIYALGTIIALFQDKTFTNALKLNTFQRRVANLNEEFIVICGYTDATKLLINMINRENRYRIVIIDKNHEKIEALSGEMYMPSIPAIAADASMTEILKASGIQSSQCKYLITLFEESQLNLKISVRARVLNKNIRIVARSGIRQGRHSLNELGVDHVIDVFSIIAQRIDYALRSPYLFNLLSWAQGGNLHVSKTDFLPKEGYLIFGRGRIASAILETLDKHGISRKLIEISPSEAQSHVFSHDFFIDAGIMEASCVIAGTNDDAFNLSIIAAAKSVNPSIFTIVRENELEERSLFTHLRVDKIFALDQITAIDGFNYIHRPMVFQFIEEVEKLGYEKAHAVLEFITKKVNKRPAYLEIEVGDEYTYALTRFLEHTPVTIGQLINNPYRDGKDLELVIMGIIRTSGEFILLPTFEVPIQPSDRILFTASQPSLKTFRTIINHYYELYYVIHGKEASRLFWNQ